MKKKVYIRISNKTNKMDISSKIKFGAIDCGCRYNHDFKPTITICLNLDIPDELFNKAQAELDLKIKHAKINSGIKVGEEITKNNSLKPHKRDYNQTYELEEMMGGNENDTEKG